MAKPRGTTITSTEKDADESKSGEAGAQEGSEQATEQAAARRPVRAKAGRGNVKPPGGANKKPGKANEGNRGGRDAREQGANKDPSADKDEEEEEEGVDAATEAFWNYIVTASYRSRKNRLDWGGGEDGE